MTLVAVLGGGSGGSAAAAELSAAGHVVRLWNRNPVTIAHSMAAHGIRHTGVLGDGLTPVSWVGTDLAAAIEGVDVVVVCLPAIAHNRLFDALAELGASLPIILNPGHTGGALHAARSWSTRGLEPPSIVEFSTLSYVARTTPEGVVTVTGRAGRLRAALLGADRATLDLARELWPVAVTEADVIATSLANVNLVLHPPAAILGAAWVEATEGDFRFYADGTTPAVASIMAALDSERLAVARAYGHTLDPLLVEMLAIGTVEPFEGDPTLAVTMQKAIAGGVANSAIQAPPSLEHRYYREDFAFGVVPFIALADAAAVPTPVAHALLTLADTMLGGQATGNGLDLARLGLAGADLDTILRRVRAPGAKTINYEPNTGSGA